MKKEHFIVYIVRCNKGTYYTGWTNDLDKRIKEHNSGRGAKYLRGRGPVTVVFTKKCSGKSAALKTECEIKKLSRAQKEKLIKGGIR